MADVPDAVSTAAPGGSAAAPDDLPAPPEPPPAPPEPPPAPPEPPAAPAARRSRLTRGTVAVAGVLALAGALFATSAAVFRDPTDRNPQNLAELVAVERARLEERTREVEALRGEVEGLVTDAADGGSLPDVPFEVSLAAGRVAVIGPGLVVGMWDAPTANAPAGARPDDLLVHQQDLEAVMNALWAGGAEAMTIQGDRVTSRTDVRCVGNVLLLHGRTYSPPYEIAAIGDPDELQDALDASPGVRIYRQYVEAVRLGWSVDERSRIEMPAAESVPAPLYATVAPSALAAGDGARSGAA